jgi:hypothetical protein
MTIACIHGRASNGHQNDELEGGVTNEKMVEDAYRPGLHLNHQF